jgi:hypothetical protein
MDRSKHRSRVHFLFIPLFFLSAAELASPFAALAQPAGLSPGVRQWTNACDFCLAAQGISPLEVGSTGLRIDLRYLRVGTAYHDGEKSDNEERELETHLTQQFSFFYMLTPELSATAIVPFPRRHGEALNEDGLLVTGNQFGIGDVALLLRVKPFVDHSMTSTAILSLTAGVKLPTGSTSGKDSEGELLDAHVQLGTGSTDYLLGASGFITWGRMAGIVNLLGSIATEGAHGHRFGSTLNYEATLRYRVLPEEYAETQLFAALGVAGEWRGRESLDGILDEDSGGNVTYIAPGLQLFFTPSLSLEASLQYPVIHGLHGHQLGEDFRVMTGVQVLL